MFIDLSGTKLKRALSGEKYLSLKGQNQSPDQAGQYFGY
jgi:hypothetical protein